MGDRVVQVPLHEDRDTVVERGREQHVLSVVRYLIEKPLHAGKEAEVGHVIGLVENAHLNAIESAMALFDQVFEATGAGDHDVDTAAQRVDLWALTHATEDGGRVQAHGLGQRSDRAVDL